MKAMKHGVASRKVDPPGLSDSLPAPFPRAATVTAVAASRALTCTREVFDAHLGSLDDIRNLWRFEALRKVPLLAELTAAQRLKLCSAFVPRAIAAGGAVITKGEAGEAFYVVERGACVATGEGGVVRCACCHV